MKKTLALIGLCVSLFLFSCKKETNLMAPEATQTNAVLKTPTDLGNTASRVSRGLPEKWLKASQQAQDAFKADFINRSQQILYNGSTNRGGCEGVVFNDVELIEVGDPCQNSNIVNLYYRVHVYALVNPGFNYTQMQVALTYNNYPLTVVSGSQQFYNVNAPLWDGKVEAYIEVTVKISHVVLNVANINGQLLANIPILMYDVSINPTPGWNPTCGVIVVVPPLQVGLPVQFPLIHYTSAPALIELRNTNMMPLTPFQAYCPSSNVVMLGDHYSDVLCAEPGWAIWADGGWGRYKASGSNQPWTYVSNFSTFANCLSLTSGNYDFEAVLTYGSSQSGLFTSNGFLAP